MLMNVPPGADTVVKVESTTLDGDVVSIVEPVRPFVNIRKRGEEARRGDVLLPRGTLLGPAPVGVCATVGLANPRVHRRPEVTLLCTGAELCDASQRPAAHQTRDSNGPLMLAALEAAGYRGARHEIVPDDLDATVEALKRAVADSDVVVFTGGVSVGEYDFVPRAVTAAGAKVRFYNIRMKPGRPLLYATCGRNRHIFGLPGNPVSVLTSLHVFVLPAIRRLAGLPADKCTAILRLPLTRKITSRSGRSLMAPARLVARRGGPAVEPIDTMGSADIAAAALSDGLVAVPASKTEMPAGSIVEFRPWRMLQ